VTVGESLPPQQTLGHDLHACGGTMSVARFVIQVERIPSFDCADVAVHPYDPAVDAGPLGELVCRCAADSRGVTGPATTRIAAELACRPCRHVWAWVARPVADAAPSAVVGIVSLVSAKTGDGVRCSIGWLFVDPLFRRRGVGQALVAIAVRQANRLGAAEMHVETLSSWPAAVRFWEAVRLAAGGTVAKLPLSGESRETAEG
jgi:GNAT superfamily N-acetyltransferase